MIQILLETELQLVGPTTIFTHFKRGYSRDSLSHASFISWIFVLFALNL
jgi:hypothetical protein